MRFPKASLKVAVKVIAEVPSAAALSAEAATRVEVELEALPGANVTLRERDVRAAGEVIVTSLGSATVDLRESWIRPLEFEAAEVVMVLLDPDT